MASLNQIATTLIPARLERLRWSRFHTMIVAALGITWILDGLEVTLAGSVSDALKQSPALHLSDSEVGLAGTAYLLGAVAGAVLFGWMTDRLGRKLLFFVTLGLYLTATALTGFSWNATSFFVFRFLTGAGIGGEYAAINSTIQEFVPARYRGWTDLCINGSFWIGAALGAAGSLVFLDGHWLTAEHGWRACFFIGAFLGLAILLMRTWVPESPRWLALHGRDQEADQILDDIEAHVRQHGGSADPVGPDKALRFTPRDHTPVREVFKTLFETHRKRTFVALALMSAQAFFYNAIFFTYALVLTKFYGVAGGAVGWYILPFALGNFLGPLLLGRLFDVVGRRPMLVITYGLSGLLLLASGGMFLAGWLTATTQTLAWMLIFFFASPAASAAYLTVSETFPIEMRAFAIAVFYAVGTAIGGAGAPYLFGLLIGSGSRESLFWGYAFGSALMLGAAVVAGLYAVKAEGKSLEEVTTPLSAQA
ncbi:MFS transporter [Lichenifustis flavocetrariae]|uniref:MFS transporter n=1 Tax=Lichenifustis flavocetrariae TaxID=2949735 RepID=A0AA41Z0L8_9HYPH|nr:MFS transporter [Lichenifustis flavocetrariae]MCW6510665.1 MFS transporter [Lichenifustis flavocetrariae]